MDDGRHPGPGRLAWVTLGLLAASWLTLAGLSSFHLLDSGPGSVRLLSLLFWLIVTGPHLMFAAAAWRGGQDPEIVTTAFANALVYAILTAGLAAGELVGGRRQWVAGNILIVAGLFWLTGWTWGFVTLLRVRRLSRDNDPPD